MADNSGGRDLVLSPGEFAYVKDTTKGQVNTYVGPNKTSLSQTDSPVVWDRKTRRIKEVQTADAVQINTIAPEGFYVVLYNPAKGPLRAADDKSALPVNTSPSVGASAVPSAPLDIGHRVNIPGPVTFPLWPGQFVEVIRGHHLRSNQYLLAQVYNDAEASANWQKAVMKPATEGAAAATPVPETFTPGKLIVIKGTDVAFFIPPTGVKIVEDKETKSYIREAVTLERLEYCILKDEDGNKRFVKGPNVVFPEPTETFIVKDGTRNFRAIELNDTSGLYIKVIADYTDEKTGDHKAGDELFITGKEQAIYFQREEHSIIRYGDQTKNYAVAVPPGEGRYAMNRGTGAVRLARGPQMLLCDPRYEVIIRRVLSQKESALWYPGNGKSLQVNAELEALNDDESMTPQAAAASAYDIGRPIASANYMASSGNILEREDKVRAASRQVMGDQFARGTAFTPPRTVTLDTKYEGAVSITIWPGYAVMVVNKTGARKVVEGPETVLLEYDETLAMLELSTGTPKVDTKLLQTVYLRVGNNKVTDEFIVETQDLVKVKLRLSYRLNFEGDDKEKWFSVENYIRLLCDHMRSLVRNTAKRNGIAKFYGDTIDVVRDATLGPVPADGKHRPGRLFEENSMKVYDVEVLDVAIQDPTVGQLLGTAQREALTSALELSRQRRALDDTKELEQIKRDRAAEIKTTEDAVSARELEKITAALTSNLAKLNAEAKADQQRLDTKRSQQDVLDALTSAEVARANEVEAANLARDTARAELEIKGMLAQTKEIVERMAAVDDKLAAAMLTFSDQNLIKEVTTTLAPMSVITGVAPIDILSKLFKGTALGGVIEELGTRRSLTASNQE